MGPNSWSGQQSDGNSMTAYIQNTMLLLSVLNQREHLSEPEL